jgi:hypothetical protein
MVPLRDFLFPTLGNAEGVFFSRHTEDVFGVSPGDMLQMVAQEDPDDGPLAEDAVVVVGARGGCLWVADGGAGETTQLAHPLVIPGDISAKAVSNAKDVRAHYTKCAGQRRIIAPVEPPGWWDDSAKSFLMFAPDLSLSGQDSCCTSGDAAQLVVLTPNITLIGTRTVLGWAGECGTINVDLGVCASWSASVTVPPQ